MAEKKLTGRIAREKIKLMEVPRPPDSVVERFKRLGDCTGVISDTMGMLPAMKITDPYSPIARAKAMAKPVRSAGMMVGRMTRRTVASLPAPRLAAASSSSASRSSRAG